MKNLTMDSMPDGMRVTGEITPEFAAILTPAALHFLAKL